MNGLILAKSLIGQSPSQAPTMGRIGSVTHFGVREDQPQGLASIGNTLYMVGLQTRSLYTINTMTGVATRVSGLPDRFPSGLASIGNTLYFVGTRRHNLYSIDPATGIATRVGSATDFGVGESSPSGLASIGNTLYMVGTTRDELYTVDTTTGIATRVGTAVNFGVRETQPSALASIGNTLYMIGADRDTLYIVDTTTGLATRASGVDFGTIERIPTGLTSIGDRLYRTGRENIAIYVSNSLTPTVNAAFSSVPGTITARTVDVKVRLSQTATGFAIADFLLSAVSGNGSTGIMVTNVVADSDVTNGYIATVSIPVDVKGVVELGIASAAMVTVGSESQSLTGNSVDITYNTITPISATMSVPMPGRGDTTATSRVTFARAINVNSFTTGDVAVTAIQGVVVQSVVRAAGVNTGGDTADQFDITFVLPPNQASTVSFDITGTVTEGSVERAVIADSQDFTFNTVPRTIAATFANFPTASVGGNYTVDVQFMTPDTDDVITGFTTGDVSLSGDTTGLTDYTITGVPGRAHDFRIHFTPSVDTEGTVNIGIAGTVLVDGVSHAVIITPIAVQYDTRNAVMAAWNGIDGIKRASPFTIELAFGGSENVAIPDSTHFDITRISGDTIANLGISDYTIRRKTGSNQIFELIFTPAENVEGVFEIDVTGRVNVGATGSQVMRDVSVPPARISVNTTNTIPQPVFDPAAIPTPIWENPPLRITEADTRYSIDLNFGENIRGLTKDDIIEEGISDTRTFTLYRVVGGSEVLHNDDTPAFLFRLVRLFASNQRGNVRYTLKPRSVTSVDDEMTGPLVPISSGNIPYDTRPEVVPITEVSIGPPENPVGQVATQPFTGDEVWHDITFTDNITDTQTLLALAGAITLRDTSNAGPANVLSANLENVGTTGTRTHFRLRVPMPDDASGVYWLEVAEGFVNNNLATVSTPVMYDTTTPAPTPAVRPEISTIPVQLVNAGETQRISLDQYISGEVNANGVSISGQESWVTLGSGTGVNRTITISPPATITDSTQYFFNVSAVGPGGSDLQRVSVYVVAQPQPTPVPVHPIWDSVPNEITDPMTEAVFELNFGENITGFAATDIREDGVTNRSIRLFRVVGGVEARHIDTTVEASLFRVKVLINANQRGNITLTVNRNSVTAVDDGAMGPSVEVVSPSVPYNTIPAPTPAPDPIEIDSWTVRGGNRLGLPFVFTANLSAAIANTPAELRGSLDIEGVDILPTDTDKVEITKAADNLSVTITITPDEDFVGSISVGIEEDDLRGV